MRPRSLTPPLPSRSSWWLEEARAHRPDPVEPALQEALEVDVAIVGGGYTGLWTALALRERDPSLRVAVLEGREIGDGPSGRNGGFLHGYWSSLPRLRAVLGDAGALQLAHASSEIVPRVRAFLRRAARTSGCAREACSRSPRPRRRTRRSSARSRAARELGVDEEAVALGPDEVRDRIALAAIPPRRPLSRRRDRAAGRLVLALKRAALDAGVQIFERTPVTSVGAGLSARPTAARSRRARSCSPSTRGGPAGR